MKHLECTLATPQENLACDEALLDWAEAEAGTELLRIWESAEVFVVVGYGNRLGPEVNLEACQRGGIPVLRRSSGGGAVVQGPGSLNYALILQIDSPRPVQTISATNQYVIETHRAALSQLSGLPAPITVRGHTDLALGDKKFSGNAQRRRRRYLLFHGTVLYRFDLGLIQDLLHLPSRQPDYRAGRGHREFLCNLPAAREQIAASLRRAWKADELLDGLPPDRIQSLLLEKYANPAWICKFR